MSWFPKPSSPRIAFQDLRAFMRQRSREQVIGFSLALLVTAIIIIEFLIDSNWNTTPTEDIVYADSWPANRTDAEIIADQQKDQNELEAAQKERQRQFQKLEKQLHM